MNSWRGLLWLRCVLAAAVVLPAVTILSWFVYSVQFTNEWAEPSAPDSTPALALCGLFGLAPLGVGVIWLACRALFRPDSELFATLAAGCGLGTLMATISLGDALVIGLGWKDVRVPPVVLAAVGVVWLYFMAVGFGYWRLAKLFAVAPRPPIRGQD